MSKQKRLDRPKWRENTYHEIREILRVVNGIRNFGFGTAYNDYVDQILALLPDVEEAKKQERIVLYKQFSKKWNGVIVNGTVELFPFPYEWFAKLKAGQALKEG